MMIADGAAQAAYEHRQPVYNKWAEFGITRENQIDLLFQFLGKGSFYAEMSDAQIQLCQQLSGPHGYAIYKMLLLKHGIE